VARAKSVTARIGSALRISTGALLERYRRGRSSAIEILLAREASSLRRWARGRLPRWARPLIDTDDIIQSALLRTLPHFERFEPRHKRALAAYLRRAVQAQIVDELRRVRCRPNTEALDDERPIDLPSAEPSQLEHLMDAENAARFSTALAQLKERDRVAVVARLRLQYSYEQIAISLGLRSPDSARMVVTRALEKLIALLNDPASRG